MPNITEVIRTTGGTELRLSDSKPQVTLSTPSDVTIEVADTDVSITTAGSSITIRAGVITINATQVRLEAPLVTANVIRCDTIVANCVVGTSYTPGVGNLM